MRSNARRDKTADRCVIVRFTLIHLPFGEVGLSGPGGAEPLSALYAFRVRDCPRFAWFISVIFELVGVVLLVALAPPGP